MPHKFCVLTSGRSGSRLLFKALEEHPGLKIPQVSEIFYLTYADETTRSIREKMSGKSWEIKDDSWQNIQYVDECLKSFDGIKIVDYQLQNTNVLDELVNREYKIILLTRQNKFDVYYSAEHARQTNIWHSQTPIDQIELEINTDKMMSSMAFHAIYEDDFRKRFSSCFLEIIYEDLIENWNKNIQNLLRYIDVDEIELPKMLVKTITEKKIKNLKEVKECLNQHYLSRYLSSLP